MFDTKVSPARTIDEVIARMEDIDAALPDADGVKWFNRLYLLVTRNVKANLENPAAWRDRDWTIDMVPVFANLYFDALDAWESGSGGCPRAWRPLFAARRDPRIARLQFALAGMNAHINRDLPCAIVATCEQRGTQPDSDLPLHADYLFVNDILEAAEKIAMHDPSVGLVADLPFGLPALTDVLAMWSVRKARDAAWVNAQVLWELSPPHRELHVGVVDAYVGGFSRGLLAHLPLEESIDMLLVPSQRSAPSQRGAVLAPS